MILRPAQAAQLREVRDRLASVGVCVSCHWRLARENRLECWTCSYKTRARRRRSIAYQGNKRCGWCRRKGHDQRMCRNKRTEEMRKEAQ